MVSGGVLISFLSQQLTHHRIMRSLQYIIVSIVTAGSQVRVEQHPYVYR